MKQYIYNDIRTITDAVDFSPFAGKTVLITGAGQLLGYYLAVAFLINNEISGAATKIIAVDNDEKIFERYGKLTQREEIEFAVSNDYSYLGTERADYVIHTQRLDTPNYATAIANLLKFIKKCGACSVINVYDSVYGDVFNGRDKISESDLGYVEISSPEAFPVQSQRIILSLSEKFSRENGLNIKLGISSLVYGAWEFTGAKTYNNLLSNAVQKHNLIVDLRDNMPRSYTYVTDCAAALLTVLLKGEACELYNIASGFTASVPEIADACVAAFGGSFKVVFKGKERPLSPISPNLMILDNSRLIALGFRPRVNILNGVKISAAILSESKGGV